jgi:hypothetical protein
MHLDWFSAGAIVGIVIYIVLCNTRMWSRVRRRLRIRTVATEDAVKVAREVCDRRGWPWQEPVLIHESPINYWLMTNSRSRGGNCNFVVSMRSATIRKAAFAGR